MQTVQVVGRHASCQTEGQDAIPIQSCLMPAPSSFSDLPVAKSLPAVEETIGPSAQAKDVSGAGHVDAIAEHEGGEGLSTVGPQIKVSHWAWQANISVAWVE